MRRIEIYGVAMLSFVLGCAGSSKGPEEAVPEDGKADSFFNPTDHGGIGLNDRARAEIASDSWFHAWTLQVQDEVELTLMTGPPGRSAIEVDTVMYLYRQQPNGRWGRYIAKNDDSKGSVFSAITRSLEAGAYRVVIKGYSSRDTGSFELSTRCSGEACTVRQPAFCLTSADLLSEYVEGERGGSVGYPSYELFKQLAETYRLHEETQDGGAFDLFDASSGGEVTVYQWWPRGQSFTAVEFYPGDNAYGYIFKGDSLDVVASIVDGELDCVSGAYVPGICDVDSEDEDGSAAGSLEWYFDRVDEQSLTRTTYWEHQARQLVDTAAWNQLDPATIEELFARSEGNDVYYYTWEENGASYEAVMSYPGGNKYGRIYKAGTAEPVAEVRDSDLICY